MLNCPRPTALVSEPGDFVLNRRIRVIGQRRQVADAKTVLLRKCHGRCYHKRYSPR